MSPFDNFDALEVITKNTVGMNIGNMVFPYSMHRTLMTDDVQIDMIRTDLRKTKADVDYFNSEYSCLVLPFATAFRTSYLKQLKTVASLVRSLSIPCVVTGVGVGSGVGWKGSFEEEMEISPELDEAVIDFMKSILEKSSMIGIRGEITGKYLSQLGFKEERDFTVIGCPSMFLHGSELPKFNVPELTPASAVSITGKITLPKAFCEFFVRSMGQFENCHYVPQVLDEISMMYVGCPYPGNKTKISKMYKMNQIPKGYPISPCDETYLSGKGISFINVPSWLDYFKTKEFSFGSRIHGTIAGILGGVPSYITVSDSRTLELAEYHNIPHISVNDLKKDTTIFDLHERADFSALHRGHSDRFNHFIEFLNKNGLDHIYKDGGVVKNSPFDQKIASINFNGPLHPLFSVSAEEQAERLEKFFTYYNKKVHSLKKQNESSYKQSLKKIIKRFKGK